MARYFRAVALDFDGTISGSGHRPRREVLESIRRARTVGYQIILVTGRILSELRADFPDVEDHFDAIVAENGAVFRVRGQSRSLAPPVSPSLADALERRGVALRRGDVLLACDAFAAPAVLAEIRCQGLDCQLIYNRSALMVLPAGVTKGTGVHEALTELDVSHHSAIGVGDAENDHALLDECELGVAVGNAVESLRSHADVVTYAPAGEGVRELLDGPLLGGVKAVYSARWQVPLGTDVNGMAVSVAASQLNVLICGESGSGKSHIAGLFAERLISLGYCVIVVDPEGDHLGLARMRNTVRLSARDGLPAPVRVMDMMRERLTSIVLDLSGIDRKSRSEYLHELGLAVAIGRHAYGLPHWVFIDEAQDAPCDMTPSAQIPIQSNWGYALVSWRPDKLSDDTIELLDAILVVASVKATGTAIREVAARVTGLSNRELTETFAQMAPGQAFIGLRPRHGSSRVFDVAIRTTAHIRHWHKYTATNLDPQRWFYFRDSNDHITATAANLTDLQVVLSTSGDDVLYHHARAHDLSHWVDRVFRDHDLAEQLAPIEARIADGSVNASVGRLNLMSAIRKRYGV